MRQFFTKHTRYIGILQVATAAVLGVLSIWYGAWYPDAQALVHEELKQKNANIVKPGFFTTSWQATSWDSPVPYTLLAVVLGLFSSWGVVVNGFRLEELEKQSSDFGKEQSAHADTRQNFYDALKALLIRILGGMQGFDATCRISIYRHDAVAKVYRMVFRHCDTHRYESKGRVSLPQEEGVLGATYMNGECVHISHLPEKKAKAANYCREMNKKLHPFGVEVPQSVIDRIRMPSRSYLGLAIQVGQDKKYAIAIFESTNPQQFDPTVISELFRKENSELGRFIRYIVALDRKLNPYGGAP